MTKFIEIATTHPRKTDVPASWIILNAPRPLYATIDGIGPKVWIGPFVEGIHYAAINPDDPEAPRWLEENRRLQAVVLRYVTEDEIGEWAQDRCTEAGTPYVELSAAEGRQMYMQECGRREIEIP